MTLTIKVRKDGPDAIDLTRGEFVLVDHEENVIPLDAKALLRRYA